MALGSAPIVCLTLLAANYLGVGKLTFVEILVNILGFLFVTLTIVTELLFVTYSGQMKVYSNYVIRLDDRIQSRKLMTGVLSLKFFFTRENAKVSKQLRGWYLSQNVQKYNMAMVIRLVSSINRGVLQYYGWYSIIRPNSDNSGDVLLHT